MSRGLGRLQGAVLTALYEAHHQGNDRCSLRVLLEEHAVWCLIPGYESMDRKQMRSWLATLRRTFRTLEVRKLVTCWKKSERHPSAGFFPGYRSTAYIDRLCLRITEAGINYVEERGLDRSSNSIRWRLEPGLPSAPSRREGGRPSDQVESNRNRKTPDPISTERKRLAWNRAVSGPQQQGQWEKRERELIEAALERGLNWQDLADEKGYASGAVLWQRYRYLRGDRL